MASKNDERLREILKARYQARPELHVVDGIGISEEEFIRGQINEMAAGNIPLPTFLQQEETPRFDPANPLAGSSDENDFCDEPESDVQHAGGRSLSVRQSMNAFRRNLDRRSGELISRAINSRLASEGSF